MKKQILILAIFTLAIFAGNLKVSAQALDPRTTPNPIPALTCAGTANFLHPMAGVSYDYVMTGNTGADAVDAWTWFATKNNTFIAAGGVLSSDSLNVGDVGELLDASANYGVVGSATNQVSITWSPEVLSSTVYQGAAGEPTFVVGYGTGTNCADNIQVYEINPIVTFTIDIANIEAGTTLDWGVATEQCVDYVQSAVYDNTTNEITMDYGKDTLYFEVTAANFVTNWTPTFRLVSGLTGAQTAEVGLASSYANAVAGTFITGATTSWTAASVGTDWATGTALTATSSGDVADGVSVFVRVIISNLTEESLTASPFTLAVDAVDSSGQWDMEDSDCADPTSAAADQVDDATHTVNPRPTIESANVPDSNAAAPNERITKTGE